MKSKRLLRPTYLLCETIKEKIAEVGSIHSVSIPSIAIYLPNGVITHCLHRLNFHSLKLGHKVYFELRYPTIRFLFLINIGCITDYTNIVRKKFYNAIKNFFKQNDYRVYTELSVSLSQLPDLIKDILVYFTFSGLTLKVVSRRSTTEFILPNLIPVTEKENYEWDYLAF